MASQHVDVANAGWTSGAPFYGPGAVNFDFSVFKRYSAPKLGEAGQLQLRFEGFNIFNHPQFGQPNANLSNPQVGTIINLTNTMRQLQAGVKVLF